MLDRLRRPGRAEQHTADRLSSAPDAPAGIDFYGAATVGATSVGELASTPAVLDDVLTLLATLEQDDYVDYVRDFVERGRAAAGAHWRYADITTVLAAAARLLRPRSYLEVGVRRGRSAAVVGAGAPDCDIVALDLWNEGYAGMANPGPDLVREQLQRVGYRGSARFVSGDSHVELPRLFAAEPSLSFDLITVDGDHSTRGARRDLEDVLPRLRIGGALVFDDISHRAHPRLAEVWERAVARERRYATWSYDDIGYGVAVAVRRW
jgi:predicted O-methyltransferase YrrM